jgi:hypothetical protein
VGLPPRLQRLSRLSLLGRCKELALGFAHVLAHLLPRRGRAAQAVVAAPGCCRACWWGLPLLRVWLHVAHGAHLVPGALVERLFYGLWDWLLVACSGFLQRPQWSVLGRSSSLTGPAAGRVPCMAHALVRWPVAVKEAVRIAVVGGGAGCGLVAGLVGCAADGLQEPLAELIRRSICCGGLTASSPELPELSELPDAGRSGGLRWSSLVGVGRLAGRARSL